MPISILESLNFLVETPIVMTSQLDDIFVAISFLNFILFAIKI